MADNRTRVGLEGMKRAEGNFANAITEVSREAGDVDNAASALLSCWTGTAATTFQQAIADWQVQFGKARQALERMHTTLQQNTNQYTHTHTAAEDTAQQVREHMSAFPGLPNL